MASTSSSSLKALSSLQPTSSTSNFSLPQNLTLPNVIQNPFFSSHKTLKSSRTTHQILPTKKPKQSTITAIHNSQPSSVDDFRPSKVQALYVYEINELDRGSPVYLALSRKWFHSLGDLVPFSNKLYSGDLQTRLGITAGVCILIRNVPMRSFGDRYEAIYTFHFGDYGSVVVRGSYLTYEDTWLAVTGGTGVFEGAYGQARLHQGIKDLPTELVSKRPAKPWFWVKASRAAKACESHAVAPNYTN
ncbi:hypothetical protein Cgig2_010727 [Carnegiea gigantea]|uniref:allene-oxide cyclase n=1 Tax=Carnegiea gigantea TaxID=171969 RepID=A0A9Q1KKU4_9CARY|nr:hypothetical protein Cgig2_010727 [Carnegiea gigantea]